jgi:hypothetical protein
MYADIKMTDLTKVEAVIRQKNGVKCNLAADRCIIKWNGGKHKCMEDIDMSCKTDAEALVYYSDPVNGWVDNEDLN